MLCKSVKTVGFEAKKRETAARALYFVFFIDRTRLSCAINCPARPTHSELGPPKAAPYI